jgi:hypothetical protein
MNRKERLAGCYAYKEVDRPAVYSRAGFPYNDPTYDKLKSYLNEHTELKGGWSGVRQSGYKTESYIEPYSEDFQRHVTVLHTPKGDLQSTYLASLKGQPGLSETYFLKTREDAEKYLSLPMPEILGIDVDSFFKATENMGDSGIIEASLGFSPGGHVVELFGTDNFAIMSITERDIIHELIKREADILMKRLKVMLDNKILPFFAIAGEEYIVPPIHSPDDFDDFIVKYEKPIFNLIHDAGGYVHVHCHGSIKKVFQKFVDMGTNVLHPFEAPQMGDITASEAKEMARGKLCLEGNIQIDRMYNATPDEIIEETEQLIKTTFDDNKGLIVCPSASPYIRGEGENCFPQYKAMIDTVLNWRK